MKIFTVIFISLVLSLGIFSQVKAENNIFGAQQKIDGTSVQIAKENEVGKLLLEYQLEGDKNQSRIFINVSLAEIPENVTIIDAFLSLDQDFCAGDTLDITVSRVLNSWDKSKITWSDKPGFSSPSVSERLDCSNEISKWDITELVKFFYENPDKNFGIVVYGPDEGGTQPYIKTYEMNSENSFILIDYQTETSPTPTPVESTPQVRRLYIAAIGLLFGMIVVIAIIIFMMLKKKSKNKSEKKSVDNNATIAESSEVKTLKIANNSQETIDKKDEA